MSTDREQLSELTDILRHGFIEWGDLPEDTDLAIHLRQLVWAAGFRKVDQ